MNNQHKPASRRIPEQEVAAFSDIFPGFADWYHTNYDEQGNYVGNPLPSLKILVPDEQQEKENKA